MSMAEPFIKTLKRDYVNISPTPFELTVLEQLPSWFADYNEVHPQSALRYPSPNELRDDNQSPMPESWFIGSTPPSSVKSRHMPKGQSVRLKLTLWSRALCLFLGATCSIDHCLASGQLVDLGARQGRGHLVFPVLAKQEIDYCIRIAEAVKADFADVSIDAQTRMGLSLWLAVAEEVIKQRVTVRRVACDSPSVDLIVAVEASSKFPDLASFQQLSCNELRCFSRIILNTAYRDPKNIDFPAMLDFGLLAQQVDASRSVVQLMAAGRDRRMTVYEFGMEEKMTKGKIAGSTYPLLIHELGHSFGLCDTYAIDDTFNQRCDPLFTTTKTSHEQPLSIMKDGGGYMYLTPDDEDGVRRLFLRFSSGRAADQQSFQHN